MLVSPELDIHAVLVEELLQAERVHIGQTGAHSVVDLVAIAVTVRAVHGSMAHCDDPRLTGSIPGQVGLAQVGLEPLELVDHLEDAELEKVVELGAERDEMDGADVDAVEVVVVLAELGGVVLVGHAEAVHVVGEVVGGLVVAYTRHVGQSGRYRLNLIHERVAHTSVVRVHVVGEVADVQYGVVHAHERLALQTRQRLSVHVAHVAVDGKARRPRASRLAVRTRRKRVH